MSTRYLRRPATALASTAVAGLLLTGLTACGNGSTTATMGSSTSSSVATSPAATASTTGTDLAPGSSISNADMAALLKSSSQSFSTAHAQMTMNMSAAGQNQQMEADADISMNPLAESMTMTVSGQQMQALLVDGSMYIKSAAMGSDKWIKIDLSALSSMMGGSGMTDMLSNPVSMIEQMSTYITKATYVGDESLNGATAKHYTMSVDLKAMMKKLAPSAPTSQLPAAGKEEIWIDDQGHLVKTVADFGTSDMTMLMSDFGKSVNVQAPPSSEVTDMPGLGSLGG